MMSREVVAEFLGTALLLYVIVGSGIAAQTLSSDSAVQLLAHALIVGLGLAVLILLFQSISGSHFNPAVTLGFWREGSISGEKAVRYTSAQILGGLSGVMLANLTFDLPAVSLATTARSGLGLVLSEAVATFVLVLLILALVRIDRPAAIPAAVGAWVAVIVFATSSTGFVNPAVTIARAITDTFTGIVPSSVPAFLMAQLVGAYLAVLAVKALYPSRSNQTANA